MRQGQIFKKFVSKKGKEIVLRQPSLKDVKQYMTMINSIVDEKDYILMTQRVTLAEEKKVIKKWVDEIDKKEKIIITVEHEGKIIGNCDVRRGKYVRSHVGTLGIALIKDFREEGIGTQLLKEAIKLSKKIFNLKIMQLEVYGTNKRAQALYKKLGFKYVGTVPKAIKRKGKYLSEIIMYKEL